MRKIDGPMAPIKTKEVEEAPESTKKDFVSWEINDNPETNQNIYWYLIVGLLSVATIGYFVWQKDWFPIAIVAVSIIALIVYKRSLKAEKIVFEINKLGIKINEKFFPYSQLHSFWISYSKNQTTLNIILTKKYVPTIQLNITELDPYLIKRILMKRIPEQEKRGESLVDMLARVLKI